MNMIKQNRIQSRLIARVVAFVVLLVCFARPTRAEPALAMGTADYKPSAEHPVGWRGNGSGEFPGATPPASWTLQKNTVWSTRVAKSYSSPVVTDKDVLVTSEPNLLSCLDRATGALRWKIQTNPADLSDAKQRAIADEYTPPKAGSGMMAATPLTDGKFVYIVLANGIVRTIDLDGKPAWIAFIDADQSTGYGRSASPVMIGGKLIVSMTNLYAFDPATGKKLWMNDEAQSTYGTPVGMKIGDLQVIATPAGDIVRADDGKSLAKDIGHSIHPSPLAHDGVVYFTDGGAQSIRVSAAFKDDEVWSADIEGDVFGSPILHDGVLFVLQGNGDLFAFDANGKGKINPLFEPRQLFPAADATGPIAYPSLTLAGKYLIATSNQGEMVVLEATRAAKEIARNKLADGSGATPAFSGKEIFLRDGGKIVCIGEK